MGSSIGIENRDPQPDDPEEKQDQRNAQRGLLGPLGVALAIGIQGITACRAGAMPDCSTVRLNQARPALEQVMRQQLQYHALHAEQQQETNAEAERIVIA